MGIKSAPRWFQRELKSIHPDLHAEWNNKTGKWVIFQGDSPNRIVQHPKTEAPRPLDNRILRKIRVDFFFTKNPKAFEKYLENDAYAMYLYTERGLNGLTDYLAGYDSEE